MKTPILPPSVKADLKKALRSRRTLKTQRISSHLRSVKTPLLPYAQSLLEYRKIENALARISSINTLHPNCIPPSTIRDLNRQAAKILRTLTR